MHESWRAQVPTPTRRMTRSATEATQQAVAAGGDVGEQGARLGQSGAQLGIADINRGHRVLKLGQALLGLLRGIDTTLDVDPRVAGVRACRAGREAALGQTVTTSELAMGPPQAPVRSLHGPEDGPLELVAGILVEELVGLAESGQGSGELVGARPDVVEHLGSCLGGAVGHARRVLGRGARPAERAIIAAR